MTALSADSPASYIQPASQKAVANGAYVGYLVALPVTSARSRAAGVLLTMPVFSSRLIALLGGLLLAVGVAGCNGDTSHGVGQYPFQLPINTGQQGAVGPVLQSIHLEPGGGLNVQVGDEVDIRAVGHFSDGNEFDLQDQALWSQSDPNVGTLDTHTGHFTAHNPGQTTIYAQVNNVYSDALFVYSANEITQIPKAVQHLDGEILPGNQFRLKWDASPTEDDVIGYLVYRSRTSAVFTFKRAPSDPDGSLLFTLPQPGLVYTDITAVGGVVYYCVQAVRRDLNDPTILVYGAPSRQLKVNFSTGKIGE